MEKRRKFLKFMLGFVMSINFLLNPLLGWMRTLYAKTKKIILPKDTERESLKEYNPRSIDTSNLELTPLKEFDIMGTSDYEVDLKRWRLEISGKIRQPLHLAYSEIP